MELSPFQKQRLQWSAGLQLMSWAILAALTVPLLVCAYIFNLVPPYNVGRAPLWAYYLLYGWLCGSVGLMSAAALLSLVRCPTCERFMFYPREPRVKTPVPIGFALVDAYRHKRIHCYRCGHEYALV